MGTTDLLASYNEVNSLMKANVGGTTLTIDFTKLDAETCNDLNVAISRVLHERSRKLSAAIQANNEFVIH